MPGTTEELTRAGRIFTANGELHDEPEVVTPDLVPILAVDSSRPGAHRLVLGGIIVASSVGLPGEGSPTRILGEVILRDIGTVTFEAAGRAWRWPLETH